MIDYYDTKWRRGSCPVYFRDLPDSNFRGAIYIENEYHKKMNSYLRRWRWWLQKVTFNKPEYGYTEFAQVLNNFIGSSGNYDNPLFFDINKCLNKGQKIFFFNQSLSKYMKFSDH